MSPNTSCRTRRCRILSRRRAGALVGLLRADLQPVDPLRCALDILHLQPPARARPIVRQHGPVVGVCQVVLLRGTARGLVFGHIDRFHLGSVRGKSGLSNSPCFARRHVQDPPINQKTKMSRIAPFPATSLDIHQDGCYVGAHETEGDTGPSRRGCLRCGHPGDSPVLPGATIRGRAPETSMVLFVRIRA